MSSWDEKKKQLGIQTQSQQRTDDSKSAAENWKARKQELGLVNKTVDVSDAARGWMESVERGRERGKNPAAYDSYMQARTQLRAREFGDRLTDFLSEKFGKQQNYMDKLQAQSERESSRLKRDRELYVQMLAGASYSEKLSDEAKAIGNSAGNRYQKARTAYENAVKEIDPGAYYKMTMSKDELERAEQSGADAQQRAAYQRALQLYETDEYNKIRDAYAPNGSLSDEFLVARDAGKQKYEQDVADGKTRRLQIAAGAVPSGSGQAAKLRSATATNAKTRSATAQKTGVTLAELYRENKFNPPGSYELENNYTLQGVDEDIFFALYAKDPEQAKKWVAQAKQDRDAKYQEELAAMAGEDTLSRAAYLVGGTALNLAAGVVNFVNPYSETVAHLERSGQALISGGAQGLTEKGILNTGVGAGTVDLPLIGEKGLGDLYQLSSSMLSSGLIAASAAAVGDYGDAATAVVSFLGTAVLGSSAAVGDYNECLKRGLTRQQATSHATAAGIAEAAFEHVSIDKLVNQNITKGFLKNFFQQGGIEASEEFCTTIANRLSDGVLARRDGYDTQIENRMRELMALGVDRKEAKKKAELEWGAGLISDALGGFISGGAMTAGNTAANLGQYTNVNRYNEQAGQIARESGEIEALRKYAEDNGLGWYGAESSLAAKENAAETARDKTLAEGTAQNETETEQPAPKKETRKQKMQDRQTGSDISRIREHIEQQLSEKSVQEQQDLAVALIEQYGEKIAPAVYEAVTSETARSAAEIKDADTMLSAKKEAVRQAKTAEMQQAIRNGYDLAAFQTSMQKDRADFAARYLQQSRNSGTTEMRMEAIVKDKSGNEKTVKISGFTEDGKSVRLENGKTVEAKRLQADADTVDAVRQISELDLGRDADAVLQAYRNSGETGAQGYRWVMDYATAYEQGRTNRISLKEAVSRSSLDADTVMEAYALGQKNAHAETQRRMERIQSQPTREGATGRTAKIDTSEISGKTLNSSELDQFEFANKVFELVGVDLKWFSSDEKNGKFTGKNGAYENGTVYLDIHAGRNFLSDVNSGILATTDHELTHFLQQYAPEQYQALKEFIFQQIAKSGKNGEMRLERLIWEKQRRSSSRLSRKAAEDEVVADACQTILRDSKAIHEFAKQDAGAVKGIARWLDGWFKKLQKMFDSSAKLSEEAQIMNKLAKDVRKAFGDLWDKALKEAVQTHDRVGIMENSSMEGGNVTKKSDAQYSTRSDTSYLKAVERGDMETIRFSMRDPVETTDRLIAWHNMSEDALRSALELGGLAMPSWAIKTADRAHTSYGTVSVIAPRSLVDPKMNKKSMIFGGDAWTPVFPDVNYKISSDAVDALTDEIEGLIGKDALHDLGGAALDETNIADQFSKNGGTVSNYYKRNQALRYAYLKSIGQDIELPKTAKRLDKFGKYENDAVENFASRLVNGKKSLDYYRNMSSKELMQDQDLKNAITDTMVTMYGEEVRDVYAPEELSFSDIDAMLHAASKYFSEGIQEQLDSRAVGKAIDNVIDESAYEKWIGDKLNATIERKGIRNNKDPFTPSGKRRGFDELNYAYNLANIVKAMKAQPKQGRTQFLSGPGSVKGAALKNYSTVEQVRADRGRLVNTAEEGKAAYDEYNDNLADILDRMKKNGDRFDTADALIEILQHAKTEDAIYRYMERELKDWYNVSSELAHDIYKLIGQINELPMEYFEGKTYDAVGFDETAAVVVPDSIDPVLKRQLAMAGANVVEYRDGDNEDRLEKVNSVENVQFSERDYETPTDTDLLMNASESAATNPNQLGLLKDYKALGKRAEILQKRLDALMQEKADREASGKEYKAGYLKIKESEIAKLERELEAVHTSMEKKMLTPQLFKLLEAERDAAAKIAVERKEEVFQRYKERKQKTAIRDRIASLKAELQRRLTNPTDRSYVPAELATALVDALDAIDNSPKVGTGAAAAYQSVSERLRTLAAAYESLTTDQEVGWEYKSEYDEKIKKQISDLAKAMQGRHLKELTKTELEQVYDLVKSIRDSMRQATKLINKTKFADVYDAIDSLVSQQTDMTHMADASRTEQRKRRRLLSGLSPMRAVEMMGNWDRSSALYQMFQAVEQGVVDATGWIMGYNKRLQTLKTGKNEKAYRDSMTKMLDYGAVDKNSGKNVRMTKMQAIQLLMLWQREQASNGKFVHLQKGGAVIRDALAIQSGKSKKANSRTIAVTPELMQRIQNSLTDWDRSYMDAMREYLKQEGKATNRVLYDLKHRVLPLEENYLPYSVDKAYLETKLEGSDVFNLFVKTPGSTNETQQKAPQPVIIDGLDTFMSRHVKDMANYIGLAIPIRDFAKVFNGRLASEDGGVYTSVKKAIEENFGSKGNELILQALLDVQGGTKKSGWSADIADYLTSLQGAFVRSALLINPSVTLKQAASYIAADSVISHRALWLGNRALLSGDKSKSPALIAHLFAAPGGSTAQRLYNEIDEHTSMHWERRQGMSYSELADQAQHSGAIRRRINAIGARMEQNKFGHGLRRIGESLDPLQWIQRMDVATTATLWVACKEQSKIDGFDAGSKEFWTHTTELYERCLRETQPMYDSLHRTAVQKMSGGLMQYLFPFRTVPIQNHGQLVAAYEAMKASKNKSKTERAAAKKHFAKTVWAQTLSAVVFSIFTMLAAGMKRKTKKYRDDQEELTPESAAKGFGSDVAGTLFSVLLPVYGSELWTIGGRYIDKLDGNSGYTYDAFSVGVVDMLNELAGAGDDLFKDAGKAMRGEEVKAKDFYKHLEKMLLKGAKLVGIPAETVKTYAAGLTGNLEDIQAGRIPAFNDESWDRSNSLNAERYFTAWTDGDKQKCSDVLEELRKNTGGDEEKARNAINGAFRDAYDQGEISFAEYERFVKESGLYDAEKQKAKIRDLIRDAYVGDKTKEFNRIGKDEAIKRLTESGFYDSDDAWKTASKWEETAEHSDDEDFSYSQYGKIYEAIDANKDIKALVLEYTDHGYEKNSITSGIKSHLVENFVKGHTTEEKLKNQLSRYCGIVSKEDVAEIVNGAKCKKATGYSYSDLGGAYRAGKLSAQTVKTALIQYGGLSGDDAKKKLRWYDLQKANPKFEISEGAANSWYDGTKTSMDNGHEGAQSAGMSISDYLKAKEILSQVKGTDGNGDKKADSGTKEVAYIQALVSMTWLTDRQRAALYYEVYKGTSKTSARPF